MGRLTTGLWGGVNMSGGLAGDKYTDIAQYNWKLDLLPLQTEWHQQNFRTEYFIKTNISKI